MFDFLNQTEIQIINCLLSNFNYLSMYSKIATIISSSFLGAGLKIDIKK